MNRVVLSVLSLTVLYALVLGGFHPADLLFAAIVSLLLLLGLRRFLFDGRPEPVTALLPRCAAFVPFAGAVLLDVTVGVWQVILVVLGRRSSANAGLVAIDVGERSPTGIAVSALASGLSPGTVAVEAAEDGIVFHVLDASDPAEVEKRFQRRYQRYQKRVFP